jgi:hypothetical protein
MGNSGGTPIASSSGNIGGAVANVPKTSSVVSKIDLLKMYGLSLGDVFYINRLAI